MNAPSLRIVSSGNILTVVPAITTSFVCEVGKRYKYQRACLAKSNTRARTQQEVTQTYTNTHTHTNGMWFFVVFPPIHLQVQYIWTPFVSTWTMWNEHPNAFVYLHRVYLSMLYLCCCCCCCCQRSIVSLWCLRACVGLQ